MLYVELGNLLAFEGAESIGQLALVAEYTGE